MRLLVLSAFVLFFVCLSFAWAAVQQKPDLLIFSATWCGPCQQLKKTIEANPQLVDAYEVYLIDVDEEKEMAQQYGVKSLPTLIILQPNGKLRRKSGFSGVADLRRWLDAKN